MEVVPIVPRYLPYAKQCDGWCGKYTINGSGLCLECRLAGKYSQAKREYIYSIMLLRKRYPFALLPKDVMIHVILKQFLLKGAEQ